MNTKEMPNEAMWHLERLANSYHLMDRARKDASEHGHQILVEVKEAFRKQEPVSVKLLTRLHDVVIAEEARRSRGADDVTIGGTGTGSPGGDAGKQAVAEQG